MSILVLIGVVLAFGIWIGFIIGFSKAVREASAKMQQSNPLVVPWLFIIVGSFGLLVAIGSSIHSWWFIKNAVRTTGSVIEMREHIDREDKSSSFSPTFRFQDSTGVEHTVESSMQSYPPMHKVGDSVPILYRPASPENARIDRFIYFWFLPMISAGLGVVFSTVGAGWLRWRSRKITGHV